MLQRTLPHLSSLVALATTSAAFAQGCLIDYDIQNDVANLGSNTIGTVSVDGNRLALLVLRPIAPGQPDLQPVEIRVMQWTPASGRYTQTAAIDLELNANVSGCGFSQNSRVDLEGNTVILSDQTTNGSGAGCVEVFYLTLPSVGASSPILVDGGNLNTGTATLNGTTAALSANFGSDAELVTVNGRVLAYVGDPGVGAVFAYDVTAPAVNPGVFGPPVQVGDLFRPSAAFLNFGESLAVAADPNGLGASIIIGSTYGLPSGNPLTRRGDVRFWSCTANANGTFAHQSVPSVNSQVVVDQRTRAGHVSISNEWAFVQIVEQGNGAPGRTEVYRRQDTGWEYQVGGDFEGTESIVAPTGARGLTMRRVFVGQEEQSIVTEMKFVGNGWSASNLMHRAELYIYNPGDPSNPGALGESISDTAAGGYGRVWSFDCHPGIPYCTANPNSTGVPALTSTLGSAAVSANNFGLRAESMPLNQFGYFLVSPLQLSPPVSVGEGLLCIGGANGSQIGRYNQPGQILSSGATGSFELPIDLASGPQTAALFTFTAGSTFNFQTWYRDFTTQPPIQNTSNFARPVSMMFR